MQIRKYRAMSDTSWAAKTGSDAWRHADIKGRLTSHDDLSARVASISHHTIRPSNAFMHLMHITNSSWRVDSTRLVDTNTLNRFNGHCPDVGLSWLAGGPLVRQRSRENLCRLLECFYSQMPFWVPKQLCQSGQITTNNNFTVYDETFIRDAIRTKKSQVHAFRNNSVLKESLNAESLDARSSSGKTLVDHLTVDEYTSKTSRSN